MGEVILDFRLSSIDYEVWALAQYLDLMERQFPLLAKAEKDRIKAQYGAASRRTDPDEYDVALQMADEMADRILPRLFLAPFVLSLWSVLESAIIEIAEFIRRQRSLDLTIEDLRGSLLQRTKKYFGTVINYDFSLDDGCWQELQSLAAVRNALAHANGRIAAVREHDLVKLRQICATAEGLEIDGEFILPSLKYVRESYRFVFGLLDDLLGRVRTGFSSMTDD
jgi:hypothetical protein